MARLVLQPVSTAFNNNGLIEAGAKRYFYQTGTTTKITVYDDEDEGSELTNPQIADAYGRFAPAFVAQNRYKVVLTTADDVTLQTVDPVETTAGITGVSSDTAPTLGGDLDTDGNSVFWSKGADVASAAELLVLTDGNYFDVTGTTTITSIETTADAFGIGSVIKLHFDGALTLTHHATDLILPGGANITTAAGDEFEFTKYASGDWRCTGYALASGLPVTGSVPAGGTAGQVLAKASATDYDTEWVTARETLAANRTYYVDGGSGSDSNDGLSSGAGAFATLQKAADVIFGTLDLNGYDVTVSVADGTYTAGVSQTSPQVGAGLITFEGNTSTPASCVVSTTSSACFNATGSAVQFTVNGFELRTTTSGNCVESVDGAKVTIGGNMRFGTCATRHVSASRGGSITIQTGYDIVGNATAHIHATQNGIVFSNGDTFTLSGTPAFTRFCDVSAGAAVRFSSATFSGTGATGARYLLATNGIIDTNGGGATYFPGDSAGSAGTGGQYV